MLQRYNKDKFFCVSLDYNFGMTYLTMDVKIFISATLLLNLLFACSSNIEHETETVLEELDEAIGSRQSIEASKLERIERYYDMLEEAVSDTSRYFILDTLYSEYYQYDIDKAIYYAREKLDLAKGMNSKNLLYDAMFDLADRYALSGMYAEVLGIMERIDLNDVDASQKPTYYHIYNTLYNGMEASSDDKVLAAEYRRLKSRYRSLLLETLGKDDISHIYVETEIKLEEKGKEQEVIWLLQSMCESDALSVHERGIIYYILAKAWLESGNREKAILYFAKSALHDMKIPVKEYKSLYELAGLLYDCGDIGRAYAYITRSLNDAISANAAINMQSIYSMLPIISGSYNREMAKNKKQVEYFLYGISLLTIVLIVAVALTIRSSRRLSHANAKLKEYVGMLQESNNIKESYIGRYIDMCSYYIGGLERYRSQLRKCAKSDGFAVLMEKLRSSEFIDKELEDFYAQFDATFLDLFPDFVEQLNALLQPDKRIEYKSKDGILTTELRVAALIRLGVNDSVKIAYFLRRSVSTIYNYRVKMRNSSLSDRESFENQIMHIGKVV